MGSGAATGASDCIAPQPASSTGGSDSMANASKRRRNSLPINMQAFSPKQKRGPESMVRLTVE
jgi:hypothetical protein